MSLAQGPQRSDAGEARTRSPSVSSQALYHCAPFDHVLKKLNFDFLLLFTPPPVRRGGGFSFPFVLNMVFTLTLEECYIKRLQFKEISASMV